jgi:hypothetical protein
LDINEHSKVFGASNPQQGFFQALVSLYNALFQTITEAERSFRSPKNAVFGKYLGTHAVGSAYLAKPAIVGFEVLVDTPPR